MSLLDDDINISREELEIYAIINKIRDNLIRFKILYIGVDKLIYMFDGFDIEISGEQLKLFKQLAPENVLRLQPFMLTDDLIYMHSQYLQQLDSQPKNQFYEQYYEY